mmetsp:Transcript_38192/g.82335  ORF Transcript_38192/g.82335 Transcript_38192/m.82335 type:complete len:325 (-) Transcript_38192:103-1077(-)
MSRDGLLQGTLPSSIYFAILQHCVQDAFQRSILHCIDQQILRFQADDLRFITFCIELRFLVLTRGILFDLLHVLFLGHFSKSLLHHRGQGPFQVAVLGGVHQEIGDPEANVFLAGGVLAATILTMGIAAAFHAVQRRLQGSIIGGTHEGLARILAQAIHRLVLEDLGQFRGCRRRLFGDCRGLVPIGELFTEKGRGVCRLFLQQGLDRLGEPLFNTVLHEVVASLNLQCLGALLPLLLVLLGHGLHVDLDPRGWRLWIQAGDSHLMCCLGIWIHGHHTRTNVLVDIHLGISSAIQLREVVAPLWFIPPLLQNIAHANTNEAILG